jgi:alkyl sulfatase BDS1-like metallo-beta-lactamase superfamily hydrolase
MPYAPKDATPATAQVNRDAAGLYELADRQDFGDAARG